jgi:Flp pilus assembly protein TadG
VAVITILFVTVLLVCAAFVVDLGYAYSVKRQLSSATDAAAIAAAAAAGEGLPPGQVCDSATLAGQQDAVRAEADRVSAQNDPRDASGVTQVNLWCAGTDRVVVQVRSSRSLPTFFAQVGDVTALQPAAVARARYVRTTSVSGLRPWPVCDGTALAAQDAAGVTFATGLGIALGPVAGNGACTGSTTGWGAVDFEPGSTSPTRLAEWTRTGFAPEVDLAGAVAAVDPATTDTTSLEPALQSMVDQVVQLPVVSGCADPGCTQLAAVGAVTVRVCGVALGTLLDAGSCWQPAVETAVAADHIQFQAVNATLGTYRGTGSGLCALADRLCVGATQLFR